jgi:hypothetical protein
MSYRNLTNAYGVPACFPGIPSEKGDGCDYKNCGGQKLCNFCVASPRDYKCLIRGSCDYQPIDEFWGKNFNYNNFYSLQNFMALGDLVGRVWIRACGISHGNVYAIKNTNLIENLPLKSEGDISSKYLLDKQEIYGQLFTMKTNKTNKNNGILVFRGLAYWIPEEAALATEVKQVPLPPLIKSGTNLLVYEGILKIYLGIRDSIFAVLSKWIKQNKSPNLIITGDSFGGPMAILAALDINDKFRMINPNLCTFSSPNVGNPNFAMAVRNACKIAVGIFNKNDIIPDSPPAFFADKSIGNYEYTTNTNIVVSYNLAPTDGGFKEGLVNHDLWTLIAALIHLGVNNKTWNWSHSDVKHYRYILQKYKASLPPIP